MDENEDQEVILNPGMNQEHGLLEDNEDQESEQENEDDDQQTVLQNAQRVREQRRAMAQRTIQKLRRLWMVKHQLSGNGKSGSFLWKQQSNR